MSRSYLLLSCALVLALAAATAALLDAEDSSVMATGPTGLSSPEEAAVRRRAALPPVEAADPSPGVLGARTIAEKQAPARRSFGPQLAGTVVDSELQAVAGAVISLFEQRGKAGQSAFFGARLSQMLSDADGSFEIPTPEDGRLYSLRVDHAEFATLYRPNLRGAGDESIELQLKMVPGLRLRGRVLDEEGRPLVGASLTIVNLQHREMLPPFLPERVGTSVAGGRFSIAGLSEGRKQLEVACDGYRSLQVDLRRFDTSTPEQVIRLRSGAHSISGRVLDQLGEPVAGAWVTARPTQKGFSESAIPPVTSDSEGRFAIAGLSAGRYQLVPAQHGYAMPRPVVEAEAGAEAIKLSLHSHPRFRGVVTDAESGATLASFRIAFSRTEQLQFDQWASPVLSAEGRFDVPAPAAAGRFWLFALSPGYAGAALGPFDLVDGENHEGLVLRLSSGGGLRGRIDDAMGQPLAGARLRAEALGQGNDDGPFRRTILSSLSNFSREVISDAEGHYEISRLLPGRYRLRAEHPQHAGRILIAELLVSDGVPQLLPPQRLQQGGRLGLLVVNEDGIAEAGASIHLSATASDFEIKGVSDAEGKAEFLHLPPGRYRVVVAERAEGRRTGLILGLLEGRGPREVLIKEGGNMELSLAANGRNGQ